MCVYIYIEREIERETEGEISVTSSLAGLSRRGCLGVVWITHTDADNIIIQLMTIHGLVYMYGL